MSTDRDRKRRHEKCMFNFTAGNDKKKVKSFDNARKKRIKEAMEANGVVYPWSLHNFVDGCQCENCNIERS